MDGANKEVVADLLSDLEAYHMSAVDDLSNVNPEVMRGPTHQPAVGDRCVNIEGAMATVGLCESCAQMVWGPEPDTELACVSSTQIIGPTPRWDVREFAL